MKKFYLIAGLWAALFSVNAQQVATFDDVELAPGSWYNGSDGAGGFSSGGFWFPNAYIPDWNYWSGFSVSNMKDTVTAGYENQFSSITGSGATGSENYAVVHFPGSLKMEFDEVMEVTGVNITNSAYAYLSMRDGDDFSKKFGGTEGTDPDYLKLLVWGTDASGNLTDTVAFFLADYRFEDQEDNYIVNAWEWFDLTVLGAIKELHFDMESSDVGDWGMNTPAYFCIDDFTALKLTSVFSPAITERQALHVYPNPVTNLFYVVVPENSDRIILMESTGRILFQQQVAGQNLVPVTFPAGLPAGVYFLSVETDKGRVTKKISRN